MMHEGWRFWALVVFCIAFSLASYYAFVVMIARIIRWVW
jgi:hypothetical protein